MSDADLDALTRLAAAAAEHLAAIDAPPPCAHADWFLPCDVCRAHATARNTARAALDDCGVESARHLVAAVDALRAERELAAKLRQSWGASFNSLSDLRTAVIGLANGAALPPPGVLDERHGTNAADALRTLAALRAERDRRDALAAAVQEERAATATLASANAALGRAKARLHRAYAKDPDGASDAEVFDAREARDRARVAHAAATAHLDALLSGAAPDVVRAGVVRNARIAGICEGYRIATQHAEIDGDPGREVLEWVAARTALARAVEAAEPPLVIDVAAVGIAARGVLEALSGCTADTRAKERRAQMRRLREAHNALDAALAAAEGRS